MVTRPPEKKTSRDLLGAAAFVFLMGVFVWIGLDLFRAGRAQQLIAQGLNEAISLSDERAHVAAVHRMQEIQRERQKWQRRPARFWIERIRPFDPQIKRRLGALHRNIGRAFSDEQLPFLAERHYTLALLQAPETAGVTADIPMESFYTRNYELGWVAIQEARSDPEARFPQALVRFFETHYDGPRYLFEETQDSR